MFEKIERDDDIFQSALFLKDSTAFCIMESIRNDKAKYPTPKLFSNGKNCIIVNSDPEHPVIAWTSADFKEYTKLYDFIKQEFFGNKPFKIMSKKNFYDYLVENHEIPASNIQTLGVYLCQKLNDIEYIGHPDHPKDEEIEQVAKMLVNFGIETREDPDAKLSDYIELTNELIADQTLYVWRDRDEKITAVASLKINDKNPRVGRVYTQSQERGKSYAKMLVHYLTSLILNTGKKAVIFTDYNYLPSNRCYQAIGYELDCTIVNFIPACD